MPFALMVERHHGWTPGQARIWWGAAEWGRDEENFRAFFNVAWPSHEWYIGGRRRREWKAPWKDPAEFHRLRSEGLEMEDFEKGLMGDTRWGDTFDAIVEDAPLDALNRYKVVVLAGGVRLHTDLRCRLEEYVEAGGTVVINAPHLYGGSGWSERFLGVELPHWDPTSRYDGLPYTLRCADALAVKLTHPAPLLTPRGRAHPAALSQPAWLTRARRGQGQVYLTALDYGAKGAMELYGTFFDDLFGRHLPLRLESSRGEHVGWILNRLPGGWLVTVMNHGWDYWECQDPDLWRKGRPSRTWRGVIRFPVSSAPRNPTARDLWSGRSLPLKRGKGGWQVEVEVPGYSFVMCALLGKA